ncbi:MAG: sugar phosphate isomerase/epimerase [Planctomycetaceae bacterium]|nr:sugar phosphate isomerase/epimerase [Planctomycetaceae bacterium]
MNLTRRNWLTSTGALAGAAAVGATELTAAESAPAKPLAERVTYCLNASTVMGQKLSLEQFVDLATEAGYRGIEPWIRDIEAHVAAGKSLSDLAKRIADKGLQVESAIGFAQWIVDDEEQRQHGIEQLKRDMDLVKQLGGTHIAAPPVGANRGDAPQLDLFAVAERYAAILDVGRETGVIPQVEIWGPSRNLSRLGEAVFVAVESGHPDACILPDIYHIFRGGSSLQGLSVISGPTIQCFHFNDYPAEPAREEQNDAHRVYPGEGAAPWAQIRQTLEHIGFSGAVSLELFNREYWEQDPLTVARTGLEKMRAVLEG